MKKAFPVIVLMLVLALTVGATAKTLGTVDGHDWTQWTEETKKTYTFGLIDVYNYFMIAVEKSLDDELSRDEVIQKLKGEGVLIMEENVEISKTIQNVDEYYENNSLNKTLLEVMEETETELFVFF